MSTGFDFLRTFGAGLHEDLIYSDDDDDEDDYDDDYFYSNSAAYRPLEPHPRIRQLTDEVLPFASSYTLWAVT